jgi:hypothetical protein
MGFHELIAQVREPGDDGIPATIYDDLTAEYDGLAQGSEAKVGELTQRIQNYESEISRLKSTNYDLLMSSAGDSEGQNTNTDDKPGPTGTDSLFEN